MSMDQVGEHVDELVEDDLFSPEELAMMAAAAGQPRTPPTPEEQIADLQTQVQGLAAFICEGVEREQKLRAKLHAIDAEMSRGAGLLDIASTMAALRGHIADMSRLAGEAQRHEESIRHILDAARIGAPTEG